MSDLIIVGDEAYTPEEWDAEQRARKRRAAYHRRWSEANREAVREYKREWMRRYRARHHRYATGGLHDLACKGPTRATGCVCTKIVCYDKPQAEEAA